MSDAEDQGQWMAFVSRIPPASSQTPEYEEETELLPKAGYETGVMGRGQTLHETKEQAGAARWEMVRRLNALDPKVEWFGVAFCVPLRKLR